MRHEAAVSWQSRICHPRTAQGSHHKSRTHEIMNLEASSWASATALAGSVLTRKHAESSPCKGSHIVLLRPIYRHFRFLLPALSPASLDLEVKELTCRSRSRTKPHLHFMQNSHYHRTSGRELVPNYSRCHNPAPNLKRQIPERLSHKLTPKHNLTS